MFCVVLPSCANGYGSERLESGNPFRIAGVAGRGAGGTTNSCRYSAAPVGTGHGSIRGQVEVHAGLQRRMQWLVAGEPVLAQYLTHHVSGFLAGQGGGAGAGGGGK